ncbi:uncharacterized protein LOC124606117 [Schistocerca americana]|uniref:uncharacterized protein LOC124606117 n=1 Tax=Schistocerca americana TaxID=7009 RepID=UPI001F4F9143|nr:uncharacterized protein LOC124606117 [Schistocerca americana]
MAAIVQKDEREVPRKFRMAKGNPINFSKCVFHSTCTLVSYMLKPEKKYYKHMNYGMHLVDKMSMLYNASRNSRRRPLTEFYDLLYLDAFNSLCIYTTNQN